MAEIRISLGYTRCRRVDTHALEGSTVTVITEGSNARADNRVWADGATNLNTVKVTVNLPEPMAVELRELAERDSKTFTQALKEAISLKLYAARVLKDGSHLLVERPDGKLREIVFQ
jgi:hypothetical protein